MLISIFAAWLIIHFGGGSSLLVGDVDRLETAVKHHVQAEPQRGQLLALVAQAKASAKAQGSQEKAAMEAADAVGARRQATTAELEAALGALGAEQRARRDELLALRLALARDTTAAQWQAIQAEVFPPK